jgi:hypothetical protein
VRKPRTNKTPEDLRRILAHVLNDVWSERLQAETAKRLVHDAWGNSLDLIAAILCRGRNLGQQFMEAEFESARQSNDLVFFATMYLHANACLIAGEALTLMEAGYSSGAMAPWRSLHETIVYALFIGKHGPDTAERYLRHAHIKDREDAPALGHMLQRGGWSSRILPKTSV